MEGTMVRYGCSRSTAVVTAIFLVVLSFFFSLQLRAQVAGGTLQGTITDPSGAVVPQAQVTAKNIATDVTTAVVTNSDGFYTAANLLPGDYEVTVSSKGFNTDVRKGITLTVGGLQVLNMALRVGQETRKIEVTTEAPAVQLATSDLSAVVGATTVRELPLNG